MLNYIPMIGTYARVPYQLLHWPGRLWGINYLSHASLVHLRSMNRSVYLFL